MDTIQSEVYAALKLTGYQIHYFHPQENSSLPCVSYYESNNREYGQAGGDEYVTEVEYTVDIWSTAPETNATMALAIDVRLAALGMSRTFSYDLYEQDTRVHHKNMRYRGLIHISDQKIYRGV